MSQQLRFPVKPEPEVIVEEIPVYIGKVFSEPVFNDPDTWNDPSQYNPSYQESVIGVYNKKVFSQATRATPGLVGFPVNTVPPEITGFVATGRTLTCSSGTWVGNPGITYAYQWKANGVNIGGATSNTYVVIAGNLTSTFTCEVTATNPIGAGTPQISNSYVSPIQTILADARLVDIRTGRGVSNLYKGFNTDVVGNPISEWRGHKNNAANQFVGSFQPLRNADGLFFAGTDEYLPLSITEASEFGSIGWTIMIILWDNPAPSVNRIPFSATDNGSGALDMINLNSDGDFVKSVAGTATDVSNNAAPTTPTCIWVAAENIGANLTRVRQNGTDTLHTFGTYPTGINTAALGARALPTPVLFHQGVIAGMAIFNAALSFAEMASYETVLQSAGVIP